jgi:hypothetical protein
VRMWLRHGKLHREDGPAVVYYDRTQQWYREDRLHRDDGPAVIHPDGREEWWRDGERQPEPA